MIHKKRNLVIHTRRAAWFLAAFGVLAVSGSPALRAATDTWSSTSTTGAWFTDANWTAGAPPGVSDIAYFNNTGTNAGINFNSATASGTAATYNSTPLNGMYNGSAYGHNEGVGAIQVGSGDTAGTLVIGDSSGSTSSTNVNGTLSLNGTSIGTTNPIVNVVLDDASSTILSLQNAASGATGSPSMLVNLGNSTNNVVLIDGSGNINISANIVSPVANGQLTLNRTASSTGTGALVLSGNNIYSGGTTVANGNLVVTNTSGSGTGTGAVAVGTTTTATGTAGGGNAVLSGTGTISGLVTTTAPTTGTATIAPGVNSNTTNFGSAGTLTLKGGLTIAAGTNFNFDLASTASGTSDQISLNSSGALTLGSTLTFNYNLLTVGNLGATAYTLISGASNTLSLSGVTINSTGLGSGGGAYTPTYSVSGGNLFVTFTSASTPNYFGTTGQGYNSSSTVFDTTTADFNTTNTGMGTAKVFDPSRTAIFGGTSGTVTVATVTANAGLQFTSSGYVLTGGSLTLGTTPTIEVTNGTDTATVNTALTGTAGLTKIGAGTLVLGSTTSTFTGGVAINAGTLSVSSDANLGATANTLTLGGGTLAATANFTTARTVSGTGSIDVAPGGVLVSTGTFGTTALTLTDTGTLDLQSATPSVGALTFTAGGTLASTTGGTITASALTAPNLTSGTATVSAPLALGTGTVTVNVGTGGTLVLSSAITTAVTISKIGSGTLELDGANTALFRVQIGSASTSSPVFGGTVNVGNANALGKSQFYLDNGTLNATTDLTSTTGNAISAIGVSISGIVGSTVGGVPYGAAALTGSNMEFQGASNIYETASQSVLLTVNNTTTLSGIVSSGGSTSGKGLFLTSTNNGTLVLSGAAANTFTDAITVAGSATLVAAKATALGVSTGVTVNSGGTLLLGGTASGRLTSGTTVVPVTLAGGTFATGGNSDSAGALTLSASSNVDFGAGSAGSKLTFADSSGKTWAGTLMLLNYTDGSDALNFGTSTTTGTGGGLTLAQLNEVQYYGASGLYAGSGFDPQGDVTFSSVPEPTTVLGGMLLTFAAGWSQRRRLRAALAA